MNNVIERIASILHKQLRGETLAEDEKKELESWVEASHINKEVYQATMNEQLLDQELKSFYATDKKAGWTKLRQRIAHQGGRVVSIDPGRKRWIYTIAASIVILLGGAIYFWSKNSGPKENIATENTKPVKYPNDIAPGTDGAILTLADGRQIVLDSTNNGLLAQQGSSQIIKQKGQLIYDSRLKSGAQLTYNTITTARGKQFAGLVLSDGSKVWLNSASSINFPVAFAANERKVEVTGEVYFEVAHDKTKPFKVTVSGMEIVVVGTQFNVNAYSDEAVIKATLLQGFVRIIKDNNNSLLKPGQQAWVDKGGSIKIEDQVDLDAVIAWKNGMIVFNRADIKVILRQISRWYDVDIEYKNDIRVPKFYGEIPRSVTLSEVLRIIEINCKLQFTIEGKK